VAQKANKGKNKMKQAKLNEIIMSGTPVVTARLAGYSTGLSRSEKQAPFEKYEFGKHIPDFTNWLPKGTKLENVKRPAFVDKPAVVVAVIGASITIDGKYIRTGYEHVVEIEV